MTVTLPVENPTVISRIRRIALDERWDDFVREQNGLLFSYSIWAQALEAGYRRYGAKSICYVFEREGKILCGTIGLVLDFRFIRIFFDNVPYGGLLGERHLFPEFLGAIEEDLRKQGIHQIRITSHFLNRFELGDGYKITETCQHLVDLEGVTPQSLWDSYGSSTRRAVKKAVKNGVEIRSIRSEQEIEAYYQLYRRTMDRNDTVGPFRKDFFLSIYHQIVKNGYGDYLFAYAGSKPIAATFLIFSKDCVVDYLMVSDERYFDLRPNDLLTHQALVNTLERKCRYFDFATGYGFGDTLSKFKEKWGAIAYPFHTYTKSFSSLRGHLWNGLWRVANTRLGTSSIFLIRKLLGRGN
ncbi:MAG: GNAT family N-acetyltransferase [Candidatus Omnitrophica bacterium]|nr:GNAT family N-acetyltransferase [Candidatus Omnitrophota bacterium]